MSKPLRYSDKPLLLRLPGKTAPMLLEMSKYTGWTRQQILKAATVLLYDQLLEKQSIGIRELSELRDKSN